MNTSRLGTSRAFFWSLVLMAIVGVGIAIFIAMNWAGMQWAWSLMAILLAYLVSLAVIKITANEGVVTVLEAFLPGVRTYVELEKKKFACRGVIDNVEYTFKFHQLIRRLSPNDRVEGQPGYYSFSSTLRDELLNDMLKVNVENTELEVCLGGVAGRLIPAIHKEVVELLYREIFKEDTQVLFESIRQDVPHLDQLASTLMQGGHLPPATDCFPYTDETVRKILLKQETFLLHNVSEALLEEGRIWRITQEYHAFLSKNKAALTPNKRTLKDVQDSASHENTNALLQREFSNLLGREEVRTLSALLKEGENDLKRGPLQDTCRGEALSALTLTSLAMFFTEERLDRPTLKSAVCKLASRSDVAINQHLAYLQAREELRPESPLADLPYVSVQYVADNWERIIREMLKSPHYLWDKDAVRQHLQDGNWWTRVPMLMEGLFQHIGEVLKSEIQKVMETQAKYPAIQDVLRRLFRGLKLETIERLLEAQTSIPYLLTFDGLEGSLAELIDSLSFFDGGINRGRLLEKNVVKFKYQGEEKYFFKQYTRNSRLGVVPRTMNFELFFKTFEKDLVKAYENRKLLHLKHPQINRFEIIIHRFGLHGRDRYGFDKVKRDAQFKHALPKIRDLFASSLTPQEILNAILYEQPRDGKGRINMRPILKGILEEGRVWDFTDGDLPDLSDNCIKTLIKNDAKLKQKVCNTLKCHSLMAAANLLYESSQGRAPETAQNAQIALAKEIEILPGFSKLNTQAKVIASNYIELMQDIASLLTSFTANKN